MPRWKGVREVLTRAGHWAVMSESGCDSKPFNCKGLAETKQKCLNKKIYEVKRHNSLDQRLQPPETVSCV